MAAMAPSTTCRGPGGGGGSDWPYRVRNTFIDYDDQGDVPAGDAAAVFSTWPLQRPSQEGAVELEDGELAGAGDPGPARVVGGATPSSPAYVSLRAVPPKSPLMLEEGELIDDNFETG